MTCKEKFWLIPPELYKKLHKEFNFDFDPCPYPKTFNSLDMEWGKMNFVNPPFTKIEGGPTAFVRKAIEEQKKGKSSFITLPIPNYVNLLLEAEAQLRPLGRVKWLECTTKKPMKNPSAISGFFLKGKPLK